MLIAYKQRERAPSLHASNRSERCMFMPPDGASAHLLLSWLPGRLDLGLALATRPWLLPLRCRLQPCRCPASPTSPSTHLSMPSMLSVTHAAACGSWCCAGRNKSTDSSKRNFRGKERLSQTKSAEIRDRSGLSDLFMISKVRLEDSCLKQSSSVCKLISHESACDVFKYPRFLHVSSSIWHAFDSLT
jgi:hypothetical protein